MKVKKLSGMRVVRAKPGNILDCYGVYKKIWKGPFAVPALNENQQKDYYWTLLEELANQGHLILLLQRGSRYFGMVHAVISSKPLGQPPALFVKAIHVDESKRNRGGGKLLLDELAFLAGRFGIKTFDFFCADDQVEYWAKKRKAKKVANLMTVEV